MDAFHANGRSPRLLRDDPVLFFDDGTRSGIAIEAPKDVARHSAIGALRAVFVNHIEKREFNAPCRLACHFAFSVIVQRCHASSAASRSSSHGRQDKMPSAQPGWANQWQGRAKLERVRIYSRGAPNQPAAQGGSQWHSSRITVETEPSDRGQHAHAPRKDKEKRRRRLRCAKPSASQPKPRRMRSKRPGSLEGYWFRETPPFLCRECPCNRFRRRARQRPASTRPVRARPQAPRRQTFNSDAIQRLYESADYPMQQPAPD